MVSHYFNLKWTDLYKPHLACLLSAYMLTGFSSSTKLVVDVNVTGRERFVHSWFQNRTEHGATQYKHFPFFASQAKLLEMSNCAPAAETVWVCGVSNSFDFSFSGDLQDISKRVRFKTEGHNNHLQLIAVRLSFRWLRKLHILFGHHKTP